MVQTVPGNVVPVVELPPSEEYGDSEDIDPVAAGNAAVWIAEFISASEGVLEASTSEGTRHGTDQAIILSGVPLDFACAEREEGNAWRANITIGAQIEENHSRALSLFSQENFNVNNVSVLFAHFWFSAYNSHSCFFVYSSCCPCCGTRAPGWHSCTPRRTGLGDITPAWLRS
jgi:hypothetical protein